MLSPEDEVKQLIIDALQLEGMTPADIDTDAIGTGRHYDFGQLLGFLLS